GEAGRRDGDVQREARHLPDLLRRARSRDLLPQGLARLLPHARLRARSERLHELPRRQPGDRPLLDARQADGRRPRAGSGHVASVPPGPGRRQDPHRTLHTSREMKRSIAWLALAAAVVLSARTIVYALAPWHTITLERLQHEAGGPHLAVVLAIAVGGAALCPAAALWVAAVAVRERLTLEERQLVEVPRLHPARLALRAVAFFAATSVAFSLLESYLHWR